jgi:VWFA-related protein
MRPLTHFTAAIFVLASLAASQLPAQQSAAPPQAAAPASTIIVDARLVIVPAIVRDKKNALIPSLTRENFALTVDGKPQTLRYFDHDANVPLTVGLLIDTSQSQRSVLDEERSASTTFVEKMLAPERDQAFVIQFAHSAELLQDVTNSRPKLQKALKEVDTPSPTLQRNDNSNVNELQQQGDHHGYGHDSSGGTVLYDAVFLASDEVINKQQGRRALIILTDGDDRGSLKSLTQAIEAAQRADTMIYAIYYKGEQHGGYDHGYGGRHGGIGFPGQHLGGQRPGGYGQQRPDGKKILERMCGETGGRVYEVSKKETVEKIYAEIGEELRSQYRLGFTPSAEAASEGYHKITLTLAGQPAKDKDQAYSRDGYYR